MFRIHLNSIQSLCIVNSIASTIFGSLNFAGVEGHIFDNPLSNIVRDNMQIPFLIMLFLWFIRQRRWLGLFYARRGSYDDKLADVVDKASINLAIDIKVQLGKLNLGS